jgi:hypothetical protein
VSDGVSYNRDSKFDIQLSKSRIDERRLGAIFDAGLIERIELKSENWQWEQTGNIAIEYRRKGEPSGISVTKATCWVHELQRDGQTLVYLMFPIDRLKALCRDAIKRGDCRLGGGDRGEFDVALIRLKDILQ